MKKLGLALIVLAFLASNVYADVTIKVAGTQIGRFETLDFAAGTTTTRTGEGAGLGITLTTTGTTAGITSGTIAGTTINSSIIGGSTPAAGHFTALDSTGTTTLGDAVTDVVTITGKIAGATPLTFDGATANTVYTILAVDDAASTSKTVTLPSVTGTIKLTGTAVALTPGAAVALTVAKGTTLYTDTPTDNEDQTITFSGTGAAGDEAAILFTTVGTADEVITFDSTLVHSTGTLTLSATAARYYSVRFVSDGSKWFEVSRTAAQS